MRMSRFLLALMFSYAGVAPTPCSFASDKIQVLREVIQTGSDYDPRLETDFQKIGTDLALRMIRFYYALPDEERNGRGLVTFLLGQDNSSNVSLKLLYFRSVLSEPPCQSLSDCRGSAVAGSDEIALSYPQIVTVISVERWLKEGHLSNEHRTQACGLVATGAGFHSAIVSLISERILREHCDHEP